MKVGDIIAEYSSRYCFINVLLVKIERETPTLFVLENGNKYYKKNFRRVGEQYGYKITPVTSEILNNVEVKEKVSTIRGILYNLAEIRNHFKITDVKKLTEIIEHLEIIRNLLLDKELKERGDE